MHASYKAKKLDELLGGRDSKNGNKDTSTKEE